MRSARPAAGSWRRCCSASLVGVGRARRGVSRLSVRRRADDRRGGRRARHRDRRRAPAARKRRPPAFGRRAHKSAAGHNPRDEAAPKAGSAPPRPGSIASPAISISIRPAPVPRAVITHGHGDHARPGNGARAGDRRARSRSCASATATTPAARCRRRAMARPSRIGDVSRDAVPRPGMCWAARRSCSNTAAAGSSCRATTSGGRDPTCAAVRAAALRRVHHRGDLWPAGVPPSARPATRSTGCCIRVRALSRALPRRRGLCARQMPAACIALLREAGYDEPIYLHGALVGADRAVREPRRRRWGRSLPVAGVAATRSRARSCWRRPRALADRWSRRLPDPVVAMASGWMRVKQRAKARGVELPLVDLRPRRLGRADRDRHRARRRGDLGHPRQRRGAGPLRDQGRAARPRAGAGRVRGRRVSCFRLDDGVVRSYLIGVGWARCPRR